MAAKVTKKVIKPKDYGSFFRKSVIFFVPLQC